MDMPFKVGCFVKVYWYGAWMVGTIKEKTNDEALPWRVEFVHPEQGTMSKRFPTGGIRLMTKGEMPDILQLVSVEKLEKLAGYKGFETIPISFDLKPNCDCPLEQLMNEGCTCGT